MRKIPFILIVLFLCLPAFSQSGAFDIHWFTADSAEHTLTVNGKVFDLKSNSSALPDLALSLDAHTREVFVTAGLESCSDKLGVTVDAAYTPFSLFFVNGGVRLINHYTASYDIYSEYDLLPGLYLTLTPSDWATFEFTYLYQYKTSRIFALENARDNLISTGIGFEHSMTFRPLDQLSLTLSHGSFSLFKYYLFLSPVVSLNATYEVIPDLFIGLTEQFQYIDFFTLSANLHEMSTCLSLSWRF